MPWVRPRLLNALHLARRRARGGAASSDCPGREWLLSHCLVVCNSDLEVRCMQAEVMTYL